MPCTDRVVVTGSSRGIGHALATRLAAAGARVVLADIETGADVRLADGTRARFVPTDVGSESDVQALVDSVLAREGQIDLIRKGLAHGHKRNDAALRSNRSSCRPRPKT